MINAFSYSQPVKIEFGVGISESLESIIKREGFSKAVLICDKLFFDNGLAKKLKELTPSIVDIYSDITPNPLLIEVENAKNMIIKNKADVVLALGGGSSMDLAKFASSMVYAEENIDEYFYKRKVFTNKHVPLIVMPTTAGTGSEVTPVSVCNDEKTGIKSPLNHNNFYPYMAIVDPTFTVSVPKFVTAVTGLDAMSHALEAYWSLGRQPICDILAKESLKYIFANLEKAYDEPDNILARENMSYGALLAGLAFGQPKTAAVHACSYPLSIDYHLCHGEACAFTLDVFLRCNSKKDLRLNDLAKELGFSDAEKMADKILEMKNKFKLKTKLSDLGENVDVVKLAKDCVVHPLFNNNPIKFSAIDLENVFRSLK